MPQEVTRARVAVAYEPFQLAPFDDVAQNGLCRYCIDLNISRIATPEGQSHQDSINSLKVSAQQCPLCNLFCVSLLYRMLGHSYETNHNHPLRLSLVCRLNIEYGISSLYLTFAGRSQPGVKITEAIRVCAAEGSTKSCCLR